MKVVHLSLIPGFPLPENKKEEYCGSQNQKWNSMDDIHPITPKISKHQKWKQVLFWAYSCSFFPFFIVIYMFERICQNVMPWRYNKIFSLSGSNLHFQLGLPLPLNIWVERDLILLEPRVRSLACSITEPLDSQIYVGKEQKRHQAPCRNFIPKRMGRV